MRRWLSLLVPAALLTAAEPGVRPRQAVQLGGAVNPEGLRLLWSGSLQRVFAWRTAEDPWSALEGGATVAATPSYGQLGLFAEAQPLPVLLLRAEIDHRRFTGRYGGVLFFDRAGDPFGAEVLQDRRGQERREGTARGALRATFQYQGGALFLRAPLALSWVRFCGQGPWFYDPWYDTLLAGRDRVDEAQLQVGWNGTTRAGWLAAGPFGQAQRTREGGLQQRRAGLFAFLTRPGRLGAFQRPYLALQLGRHLRDPNREGELFLTAGVGAQLGR